jgi:hypothetical protein
MGFNIAIIKKYLTLSIVAIAWYFLVFQNVSEGKIFAFSIGGYALELLIFSAFYFFFAHHFYLVINNPESDYLKSSSQLAEEYADDMVNGSKSSNMYEWNKYYEEKMEEFKDKDERIRRRRESSVTEGTPDIDNPGLDIDGNPM